MNRSKARILTFGGIIGCLISIILLISILAVKIDISPFIIALFFLVGIVLIVVSLAYYTEK